jgi:hypothetical protein
MSEYLSRDLVEYMNENILSLVSATFHAQHGRVSNNLEVTSIEVDGYYIISNGKTYFLTFNRPCQTIDDFRNELLYHLRNYRKFFVSFSNLIN